jgi:predicted ATPase with chaperone activity
MRTLSKGRQTAAVLFSNATCGTGQPAPDEVDLARDGVSFLDELPEFYGSTLEPDRFLAKPLSAQAYPNGLLSP